MENFEKKYKEALRKATKIYRDDDEKIKHYMEVLFPELAESEDERIRKEIIEYIKIGTYHKDWLTWLEKQGEQKAQAKSAIEAWKDMRLEVYQQASGNRHEVNYSDDTTKMFSLNDIDEIIEKISEHKSANNVEPKFHEGNWITNGDYTWKIVEIKPLDYILQSQDGNIVDDTISHVDEQFHLWTIQDAKDGDVLYSPTHRLIWVYKDKDKYYASTNLNYIEAISFDGDIVIPSDVCPANRVQKSILLQKMEESGYMWDEEMKELKKIEQKLNLNEDEKLADDCNFRYIADMIERYSKYCWNDEFSNNILNWFKSLKKRIK